MVSLRTIPVLLLLTTLLACFGERTPEAPLADPSPRVLAISLHDAQGSPYPTDAAPRDLRVQLRGDAGSTATPQASQLVLLRGDYRATLAERLGVGSLPARVRTEATPFTLTRIDAGASLAPATPLEAGARYTLLVRSAAEPRAFGFTVSADPALGARVVAVLPADATRGVPRNLAAALVQLDGEPAESDAQLAALLRLKDAQGSPLASSLQRTPCPSLGLAPGTCVWLRPSLPLAARKPHRIALEPGLRTLVGGQVAPYSVTFESGESDDFVAPALTATACAPDEVALGLLCVLLGDAHFDVRGSLSEPALVTVAAPPAQWSTLAGGRSFALRDLARGDTRQVLLRLRDLAGNLHDAAVALPDAPRLASVSIDELRADPRGTEPAQEYVELLNSGAHPVSLTGFTLSTERGRARTIEGDATLAPGERALVVGPAFAPDDVEDGLLPEGVALVRLAAALSIANTGELVILRDAGGRRLSAAPALPPLVEGQCSARRGARLRSGAPEQFARDPDGHCTPGRATFEP